MGYFGMFWTQQAFHEKFTRPNYKPVLEAFDSFAQGDEDAQSVLNELKEQFSIRLVARMLELLHKEEGVPSCGKYECKLQ